jgi:two-component system CheB/CheR fusion protein
MVMVQEEASAKYDGMPRSAIMTGMVDYILPVTNMPKQLIQYIENSKSSRGFSTNGESGDFADALQKIYIILSTRTDHDFSLYKKNTICRRIERRMNIHQLNSIASYVDYLRDSDREADILFRELLIGVTNFFRDALAFENLQGKILPKMLSTIPDNYTFRVWVPGCSSGEEAYSIGILLLECMEELNTHFNVQIYATDIDIEAVRAARAGLYSSNIQMDVNPVRLRRYFTKEDDGRYRVKKNVRELVVFAPQNVIKDPPFTKLDLLSCRNLLIYFGRELQQKLLPIFHYSLKAEGMLFLGSSESIGESAPLFLSEDKKWKIFKRKSTNGIQSPVLDFPTTKPHQEYTVEQKKSAVPQIDELNGLLLVESILKESDMPPCIIINDAFELLYVHGHIGKFLQPAQGRVTANVLGMAQTALKQALSSILRRITKDKQEVILTDLSVTNNGGAISFDIIAKPLSSQTALLGLIMVVFQEQQKDDFRSKKKLSQASRR